jgi:hypothetical protein
VLHASDPKTELNPGPVTVNRLPEWFHVMLKLLC